MTTTGFITADYGQWLPFAQIVLIILMFIGGSTGSTAGGLKVARVLIAQRVIRREFQRLLEPQGVFTIRSAGVVVGEPAINGLIGLVFLSLLVLVLGSLILTATGVELVTAISAVIACQFNVGPGLAQVGPVGHYGDLPSLAKWVLSFCMIAGRLEFYTLLVIGCRAFWRR
jgi:trk system potassium uptake protein TrkH